jgi:hypothetical protein
MHEHEVTESGLIVPKGTIARELEPQTWLKEHWKRFRNLARFADGLEVKIALVCIKCNEPIVVYYNKDSRETKLVCECRERIVR